ncbi:hypothetical protein H0H81_011434 [Sphagnurus paluster]|uniref:Hemerythrin-like domain-containing protein n=1 Tax=Sphagnurus paluster TaxID=117069 RepID=A0A9P7GVI7_9AGAR|nr:hypothetical protein H0H81_011434 [Sphagnurus paluster]
MRRLTRGLCSEMAIAHNMFIRGINALHAQALAIEKEKVPAFTFFCKCLLEMIHLHHASEEELLFPFYESKLGVGMMEGNVQQHDMFAAGLEDLEAYIKEVRAGRVKYSGELVVKKLDSFTDALVEHLNLVCILHSALQEFWIKDSELILAMQEIPTLEASKLRGAITKKELKDLDAALGKRILKEVSLTTVLPLGLVLHDKSTAPQYVPEVIFDY